MTEATDELGRLSSVLTAQAIELRRAAEAARDRGAVLREVSRILGEEAVAKREQAEAARKRQDSR